MSIDFCKFIDGELCGDPETIRFLKPCEGCEKGNPRMSMTVSVIGAGAVGSFMSLALAKANIKHRVFDFDTIVSKNVQNQLYERSQEGDLKVRALQDWLAEYDGIEFIPEKWVPSYTKLEEILICCVDDMQSRRAIANTGSVPPSLKVMFDTRLINSTATLYASTNPQQLLETMEYDNEDVPDETSTCNQPSSTLETVLTSVGVQLTAIKHYIATGELLWNTCIVDAKNGVFVTTNRK